MTIQVHADLRGLVMPPSPQVRQSIPTSFDLPGGQVGMPFTLEECIRLAHLGYDPPSPIEHYYRWPCEPMKLPEIPGLEREKLAKLRTYNENH